MTVSQIIDDSFLSLAGKYVEMYQQNGKNFITCFVKFKSIRMACGFIRAACKRHWEEFETDKDFTDYCNKFDLRDIDKRLLNDMLKIIYVTLKH